MKYILSIAFLLGTGLCARAQSAEDSVRAAVNLLFDTMRSSDSARLASAFADSALLQSVAETKDGRTLITTESIKDFAALVGKIPKGIADERIQFETIRIDGALAMVWAPYQFYYHGELHHCGVDSFQLVRLKGVWKILYIIDTRRKDNCK